MRGGGTANRAGGCYNKYIWPSVTVSKQMVNKNSKKRLQQPGIEPVTLRSIPSGFVWSVPHSAATNPAECTCINVQKQPYIKVASRIVSGSQNTTNSCYAGWTSSPGRYCGRLIAWCGPITVRITSATSLHCPNHAKSLHCF